MVVFTLQTHTDGSVMLLLASQWMVLMGLFYNWESLLFTGNYHHLNSTGEQGSHAWPFGPLLRLLRPGPRLALDAAFAGRSWAREDTEQRASGGEPGWRMPLGPSLSAARE